MAPPSKSKTGPHAKGPPGSLSPPAARATTDSKTDASPSDASQQAATRTTRADRRRDAKAEAKSGAARQSLGPFLQWNRLDTADREVFVALLQAAYQHDFLLEDAVNEWGVDHPSTAKTIGTAVQYLAEDDRETYVDGRFRPALPKTAAQAALLQSQVDKWLQQGETWKAFPSQCVLAVYGLWTRPKQADTLQALQALADSLWTRMQEPPIPLVKWLLLRAPAHYGMSHGDTRRMVNRAAVFLNDCSDSRGTSEIMKIVTELAQQLPDGLGWGNTVVAPVADEAAFNKHVFMQSKASDLRSEGQYKLAKAMYERCVAYFDTLGQHWMATARHIQCLCEISVCVRHLEGAIVAEQLAREVKRLAQSVFGPRHYYATFALQQHAYALYHLKRYEQSLSLFRRVMQLREAEVLGRSYASDFGCQVCCQHMHMRACRTMSHV